MSRHEYPGIAGDTRVAIGWDRPLATFFVQLIRVEQPAPDANTDDETDPVVLWVGTTPAELPYAADAIRSPRFTLNFLPISAARSNWTG